MHIKKQQDPPLREEIKKPMNYMKRIVAWIISGIFSLTTVVILISALTQNPAKGQPVSGCNKQTSTSQILVNFLQKNSTELTGLHKEVIEVLADKVKEVVTTRGTDNLYLLHKILIFSDDYSIKSMPYYELDWNKFMENPTKEKIMECLLIHDDNNKVSFLVEAKTGELYYMSAFKNLESGMWNLNLLQEDLRLKLSWLEKELKNADSEEYIYFLFDVQRFYILYFEGQPVFYDIRGDIWDAQKVANYIVLRITNPDVVL